MARSGLIDVELFAQYLIVCHAHDHPEILDTSTAATLNTLGRAGILATQNSERFVERAGAVARVAGLSQPDYFGNMTAEREAKIPVALKADQVRISGAVNFQALED